MALEALGSPPSAPSPGEQTQDSTTEEEHLATCLLILSNGGTASSNKNDNNNGRNISSVSSLPPPPPPLTQELSRRRQCTICDKSFSSHQALGGHMASHHKPTAPRDDQSLVNTNSTSSSVCASGKVHECNNCHKTFKSGQALGGHKRLHFDKSNHNNRGGDGNGNLIADVKLSARQFDIDLNLPPPPSPP